MVKLPEELAAIYKGSFGVKGLSANIFAMEESELYNFVHLYKLQGIGLSALMFLQAFSLLKFLRRLVIIGARKLMVYFGTL